MSTVGNIASNAGERVISKKIKNVENMLNFGQIKITNYIFN